jgi:hypothetical protein
MSTRKMPDLPKKAPSVTATENGPTLPADATQPTPGATGNPGKPLAETVANPDTVTNPVPAKQSKASKPTKEAKAAKRANTNVQAGKPGNRKKLKTAAVVVTGVVLFSGGIATGMALEDPKASDEYAAIAADLSSVESERDGLTEDYEDLRDGYETLSDEIEGREAEIEARAADLEKGEGELKEAEAAVAKREKAVTGAEKEKADNTIHEGTWTVGVDIAAGTYRTTEAVGSTCYWGIYRSGTNGDDIIQNDIPGGGRPTVTLSKGQDFNTTRCGTW